jgi:hypothetical protein
LSGLTLNATFLRGSRRLAMINSQLYAQGEPLAQGDGSAARYVVSEVHPHKVMLERQGQILELNYADTASKSDPLRRSEVPAKAAKPSDRKAVSNGGSNRASSQPSRTTAKANATKVQKAKP